MNIIQLDTPLIYAVKNNRLDITCFLLDQGAKTDIPNIDGI